MKNYKLFLLIPVMFLLAGSSEMLNAQVIKGTFRLGPEVNFSSATSEIDELDLKVKNSELELTLEAGYYFIDNLEFGLALAITRSQTEVDNFEETSSGLAIGPHIEYKIGVGNGFYIPVGAGFAYSTITNEDDSGDELTFSGIGYGLFTGVEYIVNNKLGVHLTVGPNFGSLKDDVSDQEIDVTNIGIGMGFSFYF